MFFCDIAKHHIINSKPLNIFELKISGDKSHFVLKAANGQVFLSSQMYAAESGAKNGIESVRKNAPEASVNEVE